MSSPFADGDLKRAAEPNAASEEAAAAAAKRSKTEAAATVDEDAAAQAAAEAAAAATDAAIGTGAAAAAAPPPIRSSPRRNYAPQIKGNPNDPAAFNDYFFALVAFKAEHNNFHVTKDENPYLHAWLQNLKREYKLFLQDPVTSTLTATQRKVLEFMHVPLTSRGDDHWNRFYILLKSYGDRHGHVLVPRLCEVPGLGDWVTDQRRQYKAWKQGQSTQLTRERREKLDALDFAWQVRNRPEWEHRYAELVQYKEAHGDCKVPQHYKENKALGKWVAKQREQYKLLKKEQHSFLTPYRLEKLNQIGFVWQVRTSLETEVEMPLAGPAAAAAAAAAPSSAIAVEPAPVSAPDEQAAAAAAHLPQRVAVPEGMSVTTAGALDGATTGAVELSAGSLPVPIPTPLAAEGGGVGHSEIEETALV